jgi:hypothetical protein
LAFIKNKSILIHFHGGLVNETNGVKIAEVMQAQYGDEHFVFSFVWFSGVLEVIDQYLNENSKNNPKIKLLNRIFDRFRFLMSNEGYFKNSALEDEDSIESTTEKISALSDLELEKILDEEFNTPQEYNAFDGVFNHDKTTLLGIAKKVRNRFKKSTNHGLFNTIVEEVLQATIANIAQKTTWDTMKKNAQDVWKKGEIGYYFLQKLASLQKENTEVKINLMSHSAGANFICHLQQAIDFQKVSLKINRFIFMAPACTTLLFYTSFKQYFDNRVLDLPRFKIIILSENEERNDAIAGVLYSSSLLYFISGVLEEYGGFPILGLEYQLVNGNFIVEKVEDSDKISQIRQFFTVNNKYRQIVTPNAKSIVAKHGDFDNPNIINTNDNGLFKEIRQFLIESNT